MGDFYHPYDVEAPKESLLSYSLRRLGDTGEGSVLGIWTWYGKAVPNSPVTDIMGSCSLAPK